MDGPTASITKGFPSFTLVSASAGSGKTFQLAWRIAELLLSGIPFQQILAITFTNNAAREMKDRVLRALKEVALGHETALEEVKSRIGMTAHEANRRAAELLDNILNQYADFDISTIDSFMTRLFRASALEFGHDPGFELLLRADELLDEAFERLARRMSPGSEEAELLGRITGMIERERYLWDPLQHIRKKVGDLHGQLSSRIEPLFVEDGSEELRRTAGIAMDALRRLADAATETGCPLHTHFASLLDAAAAGRVSALAGRKPREPRSVIARGGASKDAHAAALESLQPLCDEFNLAVERAVTASIRHDMYPYVFAAHRLAEELADVKRRGGRLMLEDIGRMLTDRLGEGDIPEIYLKLGESIAHYLIDEFQDTSPVQWKVLLPLLDEALSVNGSLFIVGDTKQSIYSFRGADWRIMRGLGPRSFPSAHFEHRELPVNYRSGGVILRYVEEVFTRAVPEHDEDDARAAAASGLDSCAQRARPGRDTQGYVETRFISRADGRGREREDVLAIIHDCIARGYRTEDIAILTPGNDGVLDASAWLNEAGHAFISHSSLDVRSRAVVREFFALLRFLDTPVDDLSFSTVLFGRLFSAVAGSVGLASVDIEQCVLDARRMGVPVYTLFRTRHSAVWTSVFEPLFQSTGFAPLYDLLCESCRAFDAFRLHPQEEAALSRMLEVAILLEQRGGNSVNDFLDAADDDRENDLWAMQPPKTADAVTLMTIHKAKGLDFPVVIVLLYGRTHSGGRLYFETTDAGIRVLALNQKKLEHAPGYRQIYEEEEFRSTVDALNRLYVALTRAEHEMYVIGVHGDARSPDRRDPPVAWLPREGHEPSPTKPPAPMHRAISNPRRAVFHHDIALRRTRERAAVRNYGGERRGSAVHAALEQIDTLHASVRDCIDDAITRSQFVESDALTRASLYAALAAFLAAPGVQALFAPEDGTRVFREQDITTATGALLRVDRMHVRADKVTIIDFKTGGDELEASYEEQVRRYMHVIAEVFPGRTVEGVIAYVDQCRLRSVSP